MEGSGESPTEQVLSGDVESVLVDLSGTDLAGVAALDRGVLSDVIQRILDEMKRPEEAVAGFDSSL